MTYHVPRLASQTVLDVITYIQREIDPSLAYRFACRVGVCGSCAMVVNGVARWTCRTHVNKVVDVEGRLEILPLRNLPLVKDLVTDMTEFFEKWTQARGYFEGAVDRHQPFATVKPSDPKRLKVDQAIECIGCGVCYSSCDVVSWRPDYLGPAALNRAWSLLNDVRDQAQSERLSAVTGSEGCLACHTHTSCSQRCPKGLAPTSSIAGLKHLVRTGL